MKLWEAIKALEEGKNIKTERFKDERYIICRDRRGEQFLISTDLLCNCQFEGEIYEEPPKQYNFMEALSLMKEGKKFKRKIWEHDYLFEKNGYIYIHDINTKFSSQWHPKIRDIYSGDWVEVKE